MILNWFNAAEAKEFGSSLARFFTEKLPSAKQFGDKAFEQKTDKILRQMADQIVRFKQQHQLNTYKKAQLGNAFKWALRDAGIEPDYADQLTKWLMLQIG